MSPFFLFSTEKNYVPSFDKKMEWAKFFGDVLRTHLVILALSAVASSDAKLGTKT
jgi:hypothetical protein